jgi:hypothetical protein
MGTSQRCFHQYQFSHVLHFKFDSATAAADPRARRGVTVHAPASNDGADW